MRLYSNFIGIDIGKFDFVVGLNGEKITKEYKNSVEGIRQFLKDYEEVLSTGFCVVETTGGYEKKLLLTLCDNQYAVHRANTRKVKDFIRSYGTKAKTDSLDAKALAHYGHDRHEHLEIYKPNRPTDKELFELVMRRNDLTQMMVAEKNRIQAPDNKLIKESCEKVLGLLLEERQSITNRIDELIGKDVVLKAKRRVLKTVPGIGDVISGDLLALLPELGSIDRKKIASLVGLAPLAKDSGKYRGYRRTGHGRQSIKPKLYTAAMAARNSNSNLKIFYNKLIAGGKRRKVALVALMRKILVIANARIRDFNKVSNLEVSELNT